MIGLVSCETGFYDCSCTNKLNKIPESSENSAKPADRIWQYKTCYLLLSLLIMKLQVQKFYLHMDMDHGNKNL